MSSVRRKAITPEFPKITTFGTDLLVVRYGVEVRVVTENGTVKPKIPFTVIVDHRVTDGHEGFEPLSHLRKRLENPGRCLAL